MTHQVTAQDVMEENVKVLRPTTSLPEAWAFFDENKISGAPVVCEDDGLLGVVSQSDLLRKAFERQAQTLPESGYYIGGPYWNVEDPGDLLERLGDLQVSDVMTETALTIAPADSISTVAIKMRHNHVHRLIVVAGKDVVGIVSALDVLKVLEQQ